MRRSAAYVAATMTSTPSTRPGMDSQQGGHPGSVRQGQRSRAVGPAKKHYLELSVKMAPITPDHHFYIDQGIYSRLRVAFVQIGKALVRPAS